MTKPKPDTYREAYATLIDALLQFGTTTIFSEDFEQEYPSKKSPGHYAFVDTGFPTGRRELIPGDLVLMRSASQNKWRLSWLVGTRERQPGYPEWLLASARDHELCWWGNIDLNFFPRTKVWPRWRWTDRQFAFSRRWYRVADSVDGYIVRALDPEFHGDGSVTLSTRTRFNTSTEPRSSRTFPNWRTVTKAMMLEFYNHSVENPDNED